MMDASLLLLSAEHHLRAALRRVHLMQKHAEWPGSEVTADTIEQVQSALGDLMRLAEPE